VLRQRVAGNPEELESSNKRDSPRISTDFHVDRKRHFAVSLKGSSLVSARAGETTNFEELRSDPGYLKGAAQAECLSGL
jgi:hypothetical protein